MNDDVPITSRDLFVKLSWSALTVTMLFIAIGAVFFAYTFTDYMNHRRWQWACGVRVILLR